LQGRL